MQALPLEGRLVVVSMKLKTRESPCLMGFLFYTRQRPSKELCWESQGSSKA